MAQPPSSSAPLAWRLPRHQGLDVALPELSVAKECCHWLKPPGLAKPPDGRPADAKHRSNLVLAEKAFGRLLGLLPELSGASAAGQDGLSILQRNGRVKFKGGFDEPVEAGNHGNLMPEMCVRVKGAQGLCEV